CPAVRSWSSGETTGSRGSGSSWPGAAVASGPARGVSSAASGSSRRGGWASRAAVLPSDRRRPHLAILAALVAGGAVVRVLLVAEPMRFDESFTFLAYATHPVHHILTTYDFPNNHILHSLAVHFAWRVFGDHLPIV